MNCSHSLPAFLYKQMALRTQNRDPFLSRSQGEGERAVPIRGHLAPRGSSTRSNTCGGDVKGTGPSYLFRFLRPDQHCLGSHTRDPRNGRRFHPAPQKRGKSGGCTAKKPISPKRPRWAASLCCPAHALTHFTQDPAVQAKGHLLLQLPFPGLPFAPVLKPQPGRWSSGFGLDDALLYDHLV